MPRQTNASRKPARETSRPSGAGSLARGRDQGRETRRPLGASSIRRRRPQPPRGRDQGRETGRPLGASSLNQEDPPTAQSRDQGRQTGRPLGTGTTGQESPQPPQANVEVDESRPVSLKGAPGNVLWKDNDMDGNVAGIASVAYAAVAMLEEIMSGQATEADFDEAIEMVDYLGGVEEMNKFRAKVQRHVGLLPPARTVFRDLFKEVR